MIGRRGLTCKRGRKCERNKGCGLQKRERMCKRQGAWFTKEEGNVKGIMAVA